MKGPFVEAHERTIEMGEADPRVVAHFVMWLYKQSLGDLIALGGCDPDSGADYTDADLFYLLLFADYCNIKDLQADVAWELKHGKLAVLATDEAPAVSRRIYEHTLADSMVRKRFVKYFTRNMGIECMFEEAKSGDYPEDFMIEILRDSKRLFKFP